MRQLAALVIVPMLVSLLVSGCFSSVTRDGGSSTTKVDGIPFFPKKGVCKLESVWIEPLITLTYSKTITLKYASDAKPGEKREPLKPIVHLLSRAFSRSQIHRHQPQLTQFRGILSQAKIFSHEEVERIDTLWNEIGMDDRGNYERDYIPLQQPEAVLVTGPDAILVSNTASSEPVVDYAATYYYNVRRPWIGSSQLDVKLGSDGSLTEACAQVESKTLQAFLDFIPTKELIGVATGAAKAVALRAPGTVEESVELRLNVKQDNFRYTHTKYVEISLASPCRPTPGGVVEAPYALRIEAPTGGSGNIDASDTIDVTGKIKLPTGSVKQP